jgi:murein DD-endopeptidase MepM/ murein hydrolase activator NlpD
VTASDTADTTEATADAPSSISAETISVYVVQKGDTISGIAQKFHITSDTIRSANDIGAKDAIKVGQKLVILPISGIQYTVKKGDTLSGIAVKFGSTVSEISDFNDLGDKHFIKPGMELVIPNGKATAPVVQKPISAPAPKTAPVVAPSESATSSVQVSETQSQTQIEAQTQTPVANTATAQVQTPAVNVSVPPPAPSQYFVHPVPGSILTQGLHDANAVDFGTPIGTSVRAAAAGIVIIAKTGYNGGYGTYIVIQHPNGMQTLYAHLSKLLVYEGDDVTQAQQIALSGMTGRATGPHVHFEVRGGDNPWTHDKVGTHY